MRLHLELDDSLIAEIDEFSGPRGRSRFIRQAIEAALRQRRQKKLLAEVRGVLAGTSHDWEKDVAGWVRDQRRNDEQRVG